MLGKIVKYGAIIICSLICGWMSCVYFEDCSLYSLDWSIGMADVLAITVDFFLACVITQLLEKSLHNSKVEKEYFISELDALNDIYVELERLCAKETTLSLQNTNYDIGRSRKILQRMWKMMGEINSSFHKAHRKEFESILNLIKDLDKKLTDIKSFPEDEGFTPVKISRNHIYLNNSVKPMISKDMADLKEQLLRLKISINKI